MSGHGFGEEPPAPKTVATEPPKLDVESWLLREWVGRTVVDVHYDRHGLTVEFDDGESYLIYSYLQKKNPQPIFVSNTEWGRLP
jgi:hypothetical protein